MKKYSRKMLKNVVGLTVFITALLLCVIFIERLQNPEMLRAKLEAEVIAELSREASQGVSIGEKPDSQSRLSRMLSMLLGKIDLMEESPATSYIAKEVAQSLARELKVSEERRAIQATVEAESIIESLRAMRYTDFSELFTPGLANPVRYRMPVYLQEYIKELEQDPRVKKLIQIARSGDSVLRDELRQSIEIDFEQYLEEGGKDGCTENCSYFEKGGMALPSVLAELDSNGETLPLLMAMVESYTHELLEFSDESQNPLLNGNLAMTPYSKISARALEDVLVNLGRGQETHGASLEEYYATRQRVQEIFMEAGPPEDLLNDLLLDIGRSNMMEANILELTEGWFTRGGGPNVNEAFPEWFVPGNYDWAILAFGKRVIEERVYSGGER